MKIDTETLSQIFIPYKNAIEERKAAGPTNRQDYRAFYSKIAQNRDFWLQGGGMQVSSWYLEQKG